jgi:D-serine deaminase-like pyridoxal phosphate-dependent protein
MSSSISISEWAGLGFVIFILRLHLIDVVSNTKGISWRGLHAYSGKVQHIVDFSERSETYCTQLRLLVDVITALDKRGLKAATVSGGAHDAGCFFKSTGLKIEQYGV